MQLTVEKLLQDKEIIEKATGEKTTKLEIKRLGGEITIKSLTMDKLMGLAQEKDKYKANVKVVYSAVIDPNLKDNDLLKSYSCKSNPYAIVEKIFKPVEINLIADKICELSGLNDVNANDLVIEIKND
ncbi:phage tail assembly chaperone [Clostridium butyricum]|uniref:phage tail assembly chaperone n=1 Tax=Clostridium butyricum TaxID=1492 RepID=UPI00204B5A5E|nr:MAG TPA: tail assembly chaperone protein [Caudoviricetes sp.]